MAEKVKTPPAGETGLETIKTDKGLMSAKDLGNQMKKMKEVGDNIVNEYFKFELGEIKRIAPLDLRPFQKQSGEAGEAVTFIDEEGDNYITADAVLVTALKPHIELYKKDNKLRPFVVTCTGTRKSPRGTYKEFTVVPLG